eukprot:4003449-Alexandrium_andersonii.AAC.1
MGTGERRQTSSRSQPSRLIWPLPALSALGCQGSTGHSGASSTPTSGHSGSARAPGDAGGGRRWGKSGGWSSRRATSTTPTTRPG